MTCSDIESRDVAEAYLLGRLTDEERDRYEAHYFECARCYGELQALRDVREALRAQPAAPVRRWAWAAAAAAVLVLAASAVTWRTLAPAPRPEQSPAVAISPQPSPAVEEIARLAAVTPPPYEARRLRNAGPREAFTSGMARYSAGDFTAAVPLLERALREERDAEDARFYLGASQLLAGDARAAVETLTPIANRGGSPYAEEARFLSAKAHVRLREFGAAIADLDRAIALHGAREQEAVSLREQLRTIQGRSEGR